MSVQLTRRGALMSGGAMIALTACGEAQKPLAAPDANAGFDGLSKSWLDELASASPAYATALGDHRFDGELPDISAAGRAARMAQVKATQTKLAALDRAKLTRDNQVDAAMINASGGTPETGFSTGSHLSLIRRGLISPDEVRIIWTAGPMPNSPIVIRADRPQEFIDLLRGALAVVPYDEPEIWADIGQAEGGAFAPVDRSFYSEIIAIRAEDIADRRGLSGQGVTQ